VIDRERAESEARRKQIFAQNQLANRPRPNRVIPPADRSQEILSSVGLWHAPDDRINWAALTRDG
jgi:hypothetical protein